MRISHFPIAALALVLALTGRPLFAGGPAAPPAAQPEPVAPAPGAAAPEWRFTLMPYLWATGVSGTIRPFAGAPTLTIDRSIADTLESVDSAAFLSFGAERGRFVVIGDFTYAASSQEGTLRGGIPARGELTQRTLTLGAGYRAVVHSAGFVDVFGGFRAFDFRARVDAGGGAVAASPSKSFVDPILGFRAVQALSPRWSVMLYGDLGGFGVGNELAVVGSALLNYRISDALTVSGGWRTMWIDYDDGSTVVDATIGGPMVGVSFRF